MSAVTLYSKSWCPFCVRAKDLLNRKGVAFDEVDVEQERDRLEEMLSRSGGRRTVPQIFVGDHHVGGFDDMAALERRGELDSILSSAADQSETES